MTTMTEAPTIDDDLPATILESLLEELLVQYLDPTFQAELGAVQARCATAGASILTAMGPLVLKVQAPILQKYGLPPNAQGIDRMKHAVHRRVAEGACRLELLANKARQQLGLDTMPDRNATAEEVLAAKLEGTLNGAGASSNPVIEAQLEQFVRDRLQAELRASTFPQATAEYLERLLERREAPVSSIMSLLKMARIGLPAASLQNHGALDEEVCVLESPTASELFQEHVLPSRPAIIRGSIDEGRFPPLRDFPDRGFLRHCCGHRRVLVKSLAHKDREGRPVFVSDPELKLPFGAFLDAVGEHERSGAPVPFYLGKVALRRELPELAQAVQDASTCPQREFGNCFGSLIPEGVFTYFGCGRNTTAVHFDAHENLLLCLSGSKRLFLYHPSDARFLYPCSDFSRSAVVPFVRADDLERDPELSAVRDRYPLLCHARALEVKLEAGDLLYLPSCWWHCVEGSEEPNMILNWWFTPHPQKRAG